MFSNVSLQSFICNVIDVFCFPTKEVQEIYKRNNIIKCFVYLNSTDADNC